MTCPPHHRHGETLRCYNAHKCRCSSCRAARSRRTVYERRTRMHTGRNVWVPATGTMRRLQALAVAGWAPEAISEKCGSHARHLRKIRGGEMSFVGIKTAAAVARAYRILILTPRHDRAAKITKSVARKNGWVSAFAWDAIDDPAAKPIGVQEEELRNAA